MDTALTRGLGGHQSERAVSHALQRPGVKKSQTIKARLARLVYNGHR